MGCPFRVGFGFDVHPLRQGRKLMLGGVEVPHHSGCDGHSDADVLLHALCDALLGAAGLRDIGYYFPNTDEKYKNINSIILLEEVYKLITQKGFRVGNVDVTVVLEEPKLKNYIDAMKKNISEVLKIEMEDVSVKATTNEKLGYVGSREGVNAYAVALLFRD
ncbi:MAG: 2-C-methyl-D-erythritol 2,4-cyclodiphosphate synthase [Bacteroidia bacterium]|nr:2-C-methyl-D-erythritol 2,4-cyclodiphosphate synthase [Bacteroidia bacterium]